MTDVPNILLLAMNHYSYFIHSLKLYSFTFC